MTYDSIKPGVGPAALYANLFESLPGSCILLQADAPRYTILATTPEYLVQTGTTKEYLIGKGMFEAFPSNPDEPADTGTNDVKASFDHVRLHKEPHQLPIQRYDVAGKGGQLTETYWSAINKPVFGADGEVFYIIHAAEDITALLKSEQREEEHQALQQAHKKIMESEAKYHNLFESMDQGYCTLEIIFEGDRCMDYRYLETNPAFERHLGITGALGKTIREIAPTIEQKWFDFYGSVALTGNPIRIEEESKAFNKWFEVYAIRLGNQGSNKVGVFFTDITNKKKAERALKFSEERQSFLLQLSDCLRKLSDSVDLQFAAATLLGEHLGANRVGYAEDGGDGETVVVTRNYTSGVMGIEGQFKYDDYGPELLREFNAGNTVVRDNIPGDSTLSEAEKQAHQMLQIGSSINVPMLKNGRLTGIMFLHCESAHTWSAQEINLIKETADRTWEAVERARTEAALRESEERFRFMINAVPLSIWITDAEGRVEFLNQHWWDYCGACSSETTAAEISVKYLHPEDGPKVMKAFGEGMQTGGSWEVEQRNFSKDGEYRWFLNRGIPYRDPATGKINKWFGVGIDIHDRKLKEQALRRSEEELEKKVRERTIELEITNQELKRSNQNLEEFAHAASHDLKEPVRKIHFYTNHLKGQLKSQLDEGQTRAFGRIENATERMGNLIDDLLLYSHVSQRPHEKESVDLNQKVQRVLEDLELDIEEKSATIIVDKLPVVKGYPRQLQQLIQNLISNGIKYSRTEVIPQINVFAKKVIEKGHAYHEITVQDNGIGFEPEYADKIFQMFTRLHGKAEYSGTGVGLSIAKKVVENHNGVIKVKSTPGEGSTFNVLLPVV